MNKKGEEYYNEVKERVSKIFDQNTLEYAFFDFWKLACLMKSKSYEQPYKYEDSSKDFVDKYREQITNMRNDFINNLEIYVDRCIKMLEKNKCKVYYAKTNEEAHKIFLTELGDNTILYKSKSVEAKDIGILEFLEKNNIQVKETDLGDVLVQLFDYKLPTYQVGPGIHFLENDIVSKIKEIYNAEVNPTAKDIVEFFRSTYRRELLNDVKVSLTSANAIAADDGSIVLLENEGNISLISRATEKHICLVGITKIVPTCIDALLVTKLIERKNTADLAYISFIYGPSGTSDIRGTAVKGMYGAKEVVVILVDDWRTRAIKENLLYKEFVRCIGCKTCNFICTASRAFGNTFASKYGLGTIGVIRDYIHNGIEAAVKDGLFLCTGCRNCADWCPASIDLGEIMLNMKKEAIKKGLSPPPLENYRQKIIKEKDPYFYQKYNGD